VAYARYHLTTGILEGMNNRIKVIKRVAYGFRDDEYFFLRIPHALPGKRR
jgi:transposase